MKAERRRAAAVCLLAGVATGFLYAGAASARLYAELFARPAATGDAASIDEQFVVLETTASAIRAAVDAARWPADADIALMVEAGEGGHGVNPNQLHYALGYLLYPKRIWLDSAPPGTRHAIAIGDSAGLPAATVHRVSPSMALVDLR